MKNYFDKKEGEAPRQWMMLIQNYDSHVIMIRMVNNVGI